MDTQFDLELDESLANEEPDPRRSQADEEFDVTLVNGEFINKDNKGGFHSPPIPIPKTTFNNHEKGIDISFGSSFSVKSTLVPPHQMAHGDSFSYYAHKNKIKLINPL